MHALKVLVLAGLVSIGLAEEEALEGAIDKWSVVFLIENNENGKPIATVIKNRGQSRMARD